MNDSILTVLIVVFSFIGAFAAIAIENLDYHMRHKEDDDQML